MLTRRSFIYVIDGSCRKLEINSVILILNGALSFFPLLMTIAVCFLIYFCTLLADIANTMDPDQTDPLRSV